VICDCDTFDEFYDRLWHSSTVVNHDKTIMFDKTPRYFSSLESCSKKLDCPFIATYKDPRAIVASDFSRANINASDFNDWFDAYAPAKKKYLRGIYGQLKNSIQGDIPNALALSLESVCLDTRQSLEKVFAHAGAKFDLSYLLLKNLRYHHTKLPYISSNIPFQYLEVFNKIQIRRIEKRFEEFDLFFYR
jgi:hypothetical protein